MDGNIRETWEGIRVRCLQTLPDGQVLAADSLKRIRSYNFKDITDSNMLVLIKFNKFHHLDFNLISKLKDYKKIFK